MMKIDWHKKAHARSVADAAAILRAGRRTHRRGAGLESAMAPTSDASGTNSPTEHERFERLSDALADVRPQLRDGASEEIHANVLTGARSALAKVNEGLSPEHFTLGEHVGLEAVILTNGERPSFFVRDGFIDIHAPDIGQWDFGLIRFESEIRKVITSVGRLNVPVNPWFAGTCFVISEGFVLTNRHVLEAIAVQDAVGAWTLKWPDATTVDFVGEEGATKTTKFKVAAVAFAGPDPIKNIVDFAHLDVGILRVDPASDSANAFPKPVTFETNVAQPEAHHDLYVVGFPGQPRVWLFQGTPEAGSDTMQVISTIFNNKFGVKRLAPGNIKAGPGEVPSDSKGWICTHDASTLGGNSGSCVVDLKEDGFRIIGLHFAGANRDQNWAHVAARLHDYLAEFSATFVA
jgi:hypothetical protein